MSIISRTSAVLLAFAIAAPGIARADDGVTTQVRVKRVAVHSPEDARRMDRRIKTAALEACGSSSFSLADYRDAVARSDCYAAALSGAQARLVAVGTSSATPVGGR
jgi:UrcA family protein